MTRERGILLVEVLAAAVIVALLAAAAVPVFRDAAEAVREREAPADLAVFANDVDAFLVTPDGRALLDLGTEQSHDFHVGDTGESLMARRVGVPRTDGSGFFMVARDNVHVVRFLSASGESSR